MCFKDFGPSEFTVWLSFLSARSIHKAVEAYGNQAGYVDLFFCLKNRDSLFCNQEVFSALTRFVD